MNIKQLVLNFPGETSWNTSEFAVTDSNRFAVSCIESWPKWTSYGMIIAGEPGSGKTHLCHIWQEKSVAVFIQPSDLIDPVILRKTLSASCAFILEDIDTINIAPEMFFHLLNSIREEQKFLLLTTASLPNEKTFPLKDLLSRLKALPVASINAPDDLLAEAIIRKRFADFQMSIDERLIQYLLIRTERTFKAIHMLVYMIHKHSMANQHKPGFTQIRHLLDTTD